MKMFSFTCLLALLELACDPLTAIEDMPAPSELTCGWTVVDVVTPTDAGGTALCMRLDANDQARVRPLGSVCEDWTKCMVLSPGEAAEWSGSNRSEIIGHVVATDWPCDAVPSCEAYDLAEDGTPIPIAPSISAESKATR